MKKILILMLLISFVLTGCSGSSGDDETKTNVDTSVWKTYSNEYFSFKYPFEWHEHSYTGGWNNAEDDDDIIDGFDVVYIPDSINKTEDNPDIRFEVDYILTDNGTMKFPLINSEQEFYDCTKNAENNMPDDVVLETNKKITFRNYPAYKVIYIENNLKEYLVLVYMDKYIQSISYQATTDKYNQDLADEIIDSFQFNN